MIFLAKAFPLFSFVACVATTYTRDFRLAQIQASGATLRKGKVSKP